MKKIKQKSDLQNSLVGVRLSENPEHWSHPRYQCEFNTELAFFIPIYHMKKLISAIGFLLLMAVATSASTRTSSEYVQPNYLNSVKITFLSWLSGSTKISYERALPKIDQSGEICASLICAGRDKYHNDPLGFTVRYGHKFFLPDKDDVTLKGFYLRPEVMYSHYNYNHTNGTRTLANMGAVLGTVGYQYMYRRFLADFWVGGGYALGNAAETYYHHGFELWHWFGKVNTNIAMSFSIRLGICF